MNSKTKLISLVFIVMFCALFGFATAASAATIDDVPNNSLLIGNDVYQLSDTENYTFENVINSITSYGSTPVPMLFKWGGMWFDLYINYSSILDMNENHEGYVPRSQMITRQYGTLYGSGNETGTIDPVRSTYKFAYVVPDPLLKESLQKLTWVFARRSGAAGYEDVIFVFDAVGPADSTVKFEAIDSTVNRTYFSIAAPGVHRRIRHWCGLRGGYRLDPDFLRHWRIHHHLQAGGSRGPQQGNCSGQRNCYRR